MQQIFKDYEFIIARDMVGVGTTTIIPPPGVTFLYYNPRFCENPEQVLESLVANAKKADELGRLTVAGNYTLENWPFVLVTPEDLDMLHQYIKELLEARANLQILETRGQMVMHDLSE
jgi:hypothetical protein